MAGQFEVMIERNFSSAHQLRGYKGKCENLHGHNYKIEIFARGRELDHNGLLAVLDPRLRTAAYGRLFLQSLPPCRVTSDLRDAAAVFESDETPVR